MVSTLVKMTWLRKSKHGYLQNGRILEKETLGFEKERELLSCRVKSNYKAKKQIKQLLSPLVQLPVWTQKGFFLCTEVIC